NDVFFDGQLEAGWDYQLAPLGVSVADLRRSQGNSIRIPLIHHDRKYGRPLDTDGNSHAQDGGIHGFGTETRRVELYSELLLRHGYDPLPNHNGTAAG